MSKLKFLAKVKKHKKFVYFEFEDIISGGVADRENYTYYLWDELDDPEILKEKHNG